MHKLAIDVDGVLAQFNRGYIDLIVKETGVNRFPLGCRVDLDKYPPSWNYDTEAGYSVEDINKVWHVLHNDNQFWSSLRPLPGTKETIRRLNLMAKSGHDVYFLTNRSGRMAKKQTEMWLFKQGMSNPTVLLVADKLPVIQALGIDFFIDDKLETIEHIDQALTDYPYTFACNQPFHLYLRDAPYNRKGRHGLYKVARTVQEALEKEGWW